MEPNVVHSYDLSTVRGYMQAYMYEYSSNFKFIG